MASHLALLHLQLQTLICKLTVLILVQALQSVLGLSKPLPRGP